MEPGELLHRAKNALRDRLFPPKYFFLSPAEACRQLLTDRRIFGPRLSPVAHPAVVSDADELLSSKWKYFGREVRLDDPPNWRKNYLQGGEWPDRPSKNLDYRATGIAGGVKHVWEIGRWTWATTLAAAHRSTGDERYKELCLRWLGDFCERNPIRHGIHHTSGIEDAVRVLAGVVAVANLDVGDDATVAGINGLLAQQALHCAHHLSLGTSANNHLIAEYAAIAVAGAALSWRSNGEKLKEASLRGLQREILTQLNPDGTSVEQSFGYIPFIWELVLIPMLVAQLSPSAEVEQRLKTCLEFARTIRLPDGSFPKIGDDDDGRILLPFDGISRLDLVGNLLARFLGEPLLSADEDTRILADALLPASDWRASECPDGMYEFHDGGYTVYRNKGMLLTFDHGPLGWKSIAAHGHADALSITLFFDGVPIVVDPGVATYQDDPASRDRFRGTPYHSTVNFGERNQSEILGPFMWGRRAQVSRQEDGWECNWYSGEVHWRKLELFEHKVVVHDRVAGADPRSCFVLHPDAELTLEGKTAVVRCQNVSAVLRAEGLAEWRAEPSEYSSRFSHSQPTIRLSAPFTDNEATVTIEVKR